MTASSIMQEIREALEGRPDQPLVLGVCRTLAGHIGRETWTVRLAVLVLGLIWTLPVIAAYVVAGFLMSETEQRTRDFFSGLAILMREWVDKASAALGRMFDGHHAADHRSRGY